MIVIIKKFFLLPVIICINRIRDILVHRGYRFLAFFIFFFVYTAGREVKLLGVIFRRLSSCFLVNSGKFNNINNRDNF